ncbi:hypothetical protein [Streptomyces lydicus]|uniref:hypothetical protein n=1 Tax=Streptomyces lydicus TaxID=47763 RepID=UPI0037B784E5
MAELSIRAALPEWSENTDGVWTWHPQPDGMTHIYQSFDDPDLLQRHGAFHEAGHVVAALVSGLGVDGVHLTPSDQGHMFHTVNSGTIRTWSGYAAMLAAGERAADRWLRETGEWTTERAWSVERGARSDRRRAVEFAQRHGERFDFLAHPWDGWTNVCSWADGTLDAHWDRVTAVAEALIAGTALDAEAVAKVAGLPNSSAEATMSRLPRPTL